MEESALAVLSFGLGTAGNLFKGLPQFVRTAVRGRVAGLAPGAVWLALVANVLWLSFGIAIQDLRFSILSAVGIILTAGTLARFLHRTPWSLNRRWALGSGLASAMFVLLAALSLDRTLAVAGVAMGVSISLPQLLHLWRVRGTDVEVSGVSQVEIVVVVAAQIGWTTYWLTQDQVIVAAGAAYGLVTRAVTLSLLRAHTRRSSVPSPP